MNTPEAPDKKPRVIIYKASTAPDLTDEHMPVSGMLPADEAGFRRAREAGIRDSALIRLLFENEQAGVSLTYAWFKSHATLPRHSHSADCLYYIISGSLKFGVEELEPGDGFLVPKNSLYSYEAGPNGVEILEFRTATHFDISFKGTDASWSRIVRNLEEHSPNWPAMDVPPAASRMMARDK